MNQKSQRKNQRGMVTIPFLLVSMILIFFILSFLFLNMTLVHVSITQYMSYSTARKFFLAAESQPDQQISAVNHYKNLRASFFQPEAYTGRPGDWFNITTDIEDRHIGEAYARYPEIETQTRKRFYGVRLKFETFILKLKIPFLSQGEEKALSAGVHSFLGREPSQAECEAFMEKKYQELATRCNQNDCPNITKVEISSPDNGC